MKKAIYLLLFYLFFGESAYAQYFNINLGRPDPYIEFANSNSLNYQDSLWLINMDITRDVQGDYAFFPSIILINDNGEIKKEIFQTDTFANHYYADWIKLNDNEYDIVGTEYDSAGAGSYIFIKLNSELNLQYKLSYKRTRNIGEIRRFKKLPNGNFAFCGLIQNYDIINNAFEEQQAVFYLLDSLGNELWHVEYGDSINNEKFYDFVWDTDYNFYLAGQWLEPYIDADFQSLLVKVNSSGKIVWNKLYGTKQELNFFSNIKWIQNNNLMCLGGYGPVGFFQTKGAFQISIIDTLGIKKKNIEYFNNGVESQDCLFDLKNNIICAGQTTEPDGKKNSGFIVKINQLGDILWSRYYPLYIDSKKNTQWFYGIKNTPEGGYILTGTTLIKNLLGLGLNQQAWVLKIDSLGYDHISQFPTATHEPEVIQENNIISFFPNPTGGELFYRWKELAPIVRDRWVVYFYDLEGRLVYTHPMSIYNNSIMLQSLSTGVYPYVIKDSKNSFITKGKVVVQKKALISASRDKLRLVRFHEYTFSYKVNNY